MMANGGEIFKQEKLFKVLVVGDSLVGKTAFVRRYVQGRYEDNYKVTVGGKVNHSHVHSSKKVT